ncbi:very short patch repair endonuclease [Luteimonas kalidii]|uniref:Very short patch repair endonuclease n=1 Tax=Luteimonas kalidii TaxID=3042025 RepID=A0ABT6JXK8_9GAMM|nr:very short patch repair endonuclease [Luteimonas kalidii]MDH5835322.1 very short patch repair endonuclease [Luteimonas kalidii]
MPRQQSLSRSANMARIRGRDTGPELLLRKGLWHRGLRFRLNLRVEGTRPDIVFLSRKLAIFLDGCFWHGCPAHYVRPRSRTEFWNEKLRANTARDRIQTMQLLEKGWSVLRIWEHDVSHGLPAVVEAVIHAYHNPPVSFGYRHVVVRVETQGEGDTTERWHIEELMNRTDGHSELRTRRPRRLTP